MSSNKSIKFNNKNKDFYTELKSRVDAYFRDNNLTKKGNANMFFKTAFMFALYFTAYLLIVANVFESKTSWLLLAVSMGLSMSGIGLCIMHDVNHGGFSNNKFMNRLLSYFSMHLLGGHSLNWRIQHNLIHHNYTNIYEHDEDIAPPGFLRFEPHSERRPIHKFQFLYAWFFYGFMTLMWCTVKDFKQIIRFNRRNLLTGKTNLAKELVVISFSKIAYFGYMLLPYFLIKDMTLLNWLVGFLVIHFIAGFGLASIFQAAHVVEDTEFPIPDEGGHLAEHWAAHQLKTTMNFAMGGRLFTWLIGGLNFQIEHHLFPTICHVHYPKLSKIVAATAIEYNLPYNSQKTFVRAIYSHLRTLYRLGRA